MLHKSKELLLHEELLLMHGLLLLYGLCNRTDQLYEIK